uniref:Uncharacterized protein n=1 Tax=Amphimedon queenslandica TaxID=400682 RepID=A0A1X7SPE8_AMPQE
MITLSETYPVTILLLFFIYQFIICGCFYKLGIVTAELVLFIVIGVALSLILVSHSLFKHKLENISLINNPIKLIVRVLCYARKHKYPENRSALTYWEEEAPSRLDLGKDKYGGPFTEEEVEDVKTFFRMLPLFIAMLGFGLVPVLPSGDCSSEPLIYFHHSWLLPTVYTQY